MTLWKVITGAFDLVGRARWSLRTSKNSEVHQGRWPVPGRGVGMYRDLATGDGLVGTEPKEASAAGRQWPRVSGGWAREEDWAQPPGLMSPVILQEQDEA